MDEKEAVLGFRCSHCQQKIELKIPIETPEVITKGEKESWSQTEIGKMRCPTCRKDFWYTLDRHIKIKIHPSGE